SVFHAASAFCSGGLSLCRNDLATYGWQWQLYGVILPLMLLGGIGAPVLQEVLERRKSNAGGLRYCARAAVWGTLVLWVGGAGLILMIESTHPLQLRYPREHTPGKLQVAMAAESSDPTARPEPRFSPKLAQATPQQRAAESLFVSAAARGAGF